MAIISIFALGVIVIGLISFLIFRHSRRRLYELADPIPGLPEFPFFGNALLFIGNTEDIWSVLMKIINFAWINGGVTKFWLGPKLFIAITDPLAMDMVLNAEVVKPSIYGFMKAWLGNGLITGLVPIWKRHRKMLSPSFNQKILNGFVDIFAEQGEILTKRMAKEVGMGTFDLYKYLGPCGLDTICESAMGTKMESQETTKNAAFIKASCRQLERIIQRIFHIWLHPQWIFNLTPYKKEQDHDVKVLHDFSDAIVKVKILEYKQRKGEIVYIEKREHKALLDAMIEFSEGDNTWTNVELREEVDTITFAGNETTAHAICFVLSTLACLPEIQEKVVDELKEIYGDSQRLVVKEDLSKMIYLERVIKETLRLFPTVPIIARELTKEIKLEKYILPAGAICGVGIYAVHHDKSIWGENVEEFDPDRFLSENEAKRNPKCYIPFSVGPRNCIGKQYAIMSMKSSVSTILRKYKMKSNLDYRTIQVKGDVVLKPVNGHLVSIEHRTDFS